jgi:hypothetical protein
VAVILPVDGRGRPRTIKPFPSELGTAGFAVTAVLDLRDGNGRQHTEAGPATRFGYADLVRRRRGPSARRCRAAGRRPLLLRRATPSAGQVVLILAATADPASPRSCWSRSESRNWRAYRGRRSASASSA